MTEVDESNLPSAAECDRRCHEFAAITGTDTALAMFYLQDRDWSLDRALNSYFEESGACSSHSASSSSSHEEGSTGSVTDDQPYRIRLLCWNIDGLDPKNLRSRTLGVCDTINKEDPHIVFLQEVVPESEEIIQENCPMYHMIPGNDEGYYIAMMLKTGHTHVEETKILPFPNTTMMRNMLSVKCTVKGEKLHLMTTHLESTTDCSAARKEQLRQCFSYIQKREKDRTVVFGGDLNLRDRELTQIGGIPQNIYDIWEVTGKRRDAEFTWDMQRNDNLEWSFRNKPKKRFDRLYVRHSEVKALKPEYFELVGLERLRSCQRFCSDHWGLFTHFNITSKMPKEGE